MAKSTRAAGKNPNETVMTVGEGSALTEFGATGLRQFSGYVREEWLRSLIGMRQNVLVERSGRAGHAENFAPVALATPAIPGEILPVRVTALENGRLIAQEAPHE